MIILIVGIVIGIILSIFIHRLFNPELTKDIVSDLTNKWIHEVTETHNPKAIANLFCKDGNLVGTVSQTIRHGKEIEAYFDYFANKPGVKVVSKTYQIDKISRNVFLNTAFIDWMWDGLKQPLTARMTFIYKNKCIFQLHSSALPDINTSLKSI